MSGSSGAARKLAFACVALAFGVVLSLGLAEVALLLAPTAISPRLLILFEPGLRTGIARGHLPVRADTFEIQRDDGGGTLRIMLPDTAIVSIDRPIDEARRTDEIGFCNPAGTYTASDTIDILAIGDSFTTCHSILATETWSHRLGKLTGRSTYNLGRGGIGIYEYLQILKHFGLEKRPQVVVLNFYEGNDLRDADYFTRARAGELPVEPELVSIAPGITHGWLGRHSYVVNLAVAFATRSARKLGEDRGPSIDFGYELEFDDASVRFNPDNRDRNEVRYARSVLAGEVELEILRPGLEAFTALAREHGFVPLVTYMPSVYTTYRDIVRFDEAPLHETLPEFSARQRRYLAEHADEIGYVFRDFSPALQSAARGSSSADLLYKTDDLHLSVRGHEVVAAELARVLAEDL